MIKSILSKVKRLNNPFRSIDNSIYQIPACSTTEQAGSFFVCFVRNNRSRRDEYTASFFLGEIKEIKQMRLKRVASLIKSPKE
jgi:hypothetical protein